MTSLTDRVDALREALSLAHGRLPDPAVAQAQEVMDRVSARRGLSELHTVVAFAGATGSGKSSLFNTVSGLRLAQVGARRPTTDVPLACIWGAEGASGLLDWLGVPARHQIERESALDAGSPLDLSGLVLLDLPDHDSTQVAHRVEVDRVVARADLLVWVLDPQKYADAVLHERYLQKLSEHSDVILVVLNQVDRLSDLDRENCLRDLRRLLVADGLGSVPVLATSARTGEGVEELRSRLRKVVSDRSAAEARLSADVTTAAALLAREIPVTSPRGITDADVDALVTSLCAASGVPAVVQAVQRSYARRSRLAAGWPVTRWLSRLRPDPLKRLRVNRTDVDPAVLRSSLPAPTPAQRSTATGAVRLLGDKAADGSPAAVAVAVRGITRSVAESVPDALDSAVAATDLGIERKPAWWRVVGVLQWIGALALVAGLLWLLVLAVLGYFGLPDPRTPEVGVVPVPTVMVFGGLLLGLLLAVLTRWFGAIGARRRARLAGRRLRASVQRVAEEHVVTPVRAELVTSERLARLLVTARAA